MQAHLVHQLIHDEGGTSHISRILHIRDEEIQNQYLWQEYDDRTNTTNHTIYQHILYRSVRHRIADELAQPCHAVLNPSLRNLAQHEGS